MAVDRRLHLHVAVESNSDPIRGTLDDGVGLAIEFTGWLELMSAFEIAGRRAPDQGTPGDRSAGDA